MLHWHWEVILWSSTRKQNLSERSSHSINYSVQSISRVRLFVTPWTAARQASLSVTNSQSLLKLMPIESVMPFNHLIPCHPLLLPSIFPASGSFQMSQLFASGGQSIGVTASTSVLPMHNQDWSPLGWTGWISLQLQGSLKSLLQHHSLKASILLCSAFFMDQLSHPYMTTGKTIALIRQNYVSKVMSLIFSMLTGLEIAFLPRGKQLLISWLQLPSAVILEPKKIKSVTHCFHIYLPWSDRTGCHDLGFFNVDF